MERWFGVKMGITAGFGVLGAIVSSMGRKIWGLRSENRHINKQIWYTITRDLILSCSAITSSVRAYIPSLPIFRPQVAGLLLSRSPDTEYQVHIQPQLGTHSRRVYLGQFLHAVLFDFKSCQLQKLLEMI